MAKPLQAATVDPFNAGEQDSPTWGVFIDNKYLFVVESVYKLFPDRLVAGRKILALLTVVRIHLREFFILKSMREFYAN